MVSIGIELTTQEYIKTPLFIRILHNTRILKTKNSIFSTENNFHVLNEELSNLTNLNIEDMKEYFVNEEQYLRDVVKQKLKQKSQNKLHIVESLISISDDFESENLSKEEIKDKLLVYIQHLKDKGIKIYSYSFHSDEGIYVDIETKEVVDHLKDDFKYDKKTMEIKKNKHIHIIHSNISIESGKSYTNEIYRETEQFNRDKKINKFIKMENGKMKPNPLFKKGLSLLQDTISKCFKMKRSVLNSNNKHKKINDFKNDKKNESKLIKQIKEHYETIIEQKDLKIIELETNIKQKIVLLQSRDKEIEELKQELINQKNKYENNKTIITSKNIDNETKKRLHKTNKKIKTLIVELKLEEKINYKKEQNKEQRKFMRDTITINLDGMILLLSLSKQLDTLLTVDLSVENNMKQFKILENQTMSLE